MESINQSNEKMVINKKKLRSFTNFHTQTIYLWLIIRGQLGNSPRILFIFKMARLNKQVTRISTHLTEQH